MSFFFNIVWFSSMPCKFLMQEIWGTSPLNLHNSSYIQADCEHSLTLLLYCPCLCYHSFLCVRSFWVSKSASFIIICLYLLPLEIELSRGGGLASQLNPHPIFVHVTSARTWISSAICHGLFVFNDMRWEVIVHFVDTDRTVNHHCLNFIFIKEQ